MSNLLSNQRLTFRLHSWTQKKRLGHTKGFPSQTQKLELHTKQIAPCESTAEEVSFEWSHHRISTLAPEVCSQNERTISIDEKKICPGTQGIEFHPQTQKLDSLRKAHMSM